MRNILPVNIRPHLIPFLYNEFEGIEAHYLNRKVKAAKISTKGSLGKIIRMLAVRSDLPIKPDKFNMFLSVSSIEKKSRYFGHVYKSENGTHSFLRLPDEAGFLINELFEDIFRTCLVYYINGYKDSNNKIQTNDEGIIAAIKEFIDKYDLLECGFSVNSLRRVYYYQLKKNARLSRLQKQSSNKVMNY